MKDLINNVLDECGYQTNPYFTALRDSTFTKEDFVETQIQFYYAVEFFSRPMAALAAKVPTADLRIEVVRNVWEEHGEGNVSKIHATTFVDFLDRLDGVTPEMIQQKGLWPEVRVFNTCLSGACVLDDYLIGVGVLGIIERMFCEISTWIGEGIITNGWLTSETLVHYDLHAELDIKHSDDFFRILQPTWDDNKNSHYSIYQGLRMGAALFNNLYRDLYENRARRYGNADGERHMRSGLDK